MKDEIKPRGHRVGGLSGKCVVFRLGSSVLPVVIAGNKSPAAYMRTRSYKMFGAVHMMLAKITECSTQDQETWWYLGAFLKTLRVELLRVVNSKASG